MGGKQPINLAHPIPFTWNVRRPIRHRPGPKTPQTTIRLAANLILKTWMAQCTSKAEFVELAANRSELGSPLVVLTGNVSLGKLKPLRKAWYRHTWHLEEFPPSFPRIVHIICFCRCVVVFKCVYSMSVAHWECEKITHTANSKFKPTTSQSQIPGLHWLAMTPPTIHLSQYTVINSQRLRKATPTASLCSCTTGCNTGVVSINHGQYQLQRQHWQPHHDNHYFTIYPYLTILRQTNREQPSQSPLWQGINFLSSTYTRLTTTQMSYNAGNLFKQSKDMKRSLIYNPLWLSITTTYNKLSSAFACNLHKWFCILKNVICVNFACLRISNFKDMPTSKY